MKKIFLILAVALYFNASAVTVCYQNMGGSSFPPDCFNSNGTCEGTWSACCGMSECGCSCAALGYCYSCDPSNAIYVMTFEEDHLLIHSLGKLIKKIGYTGIGNIDNTLIQFDVDEYFGFITINLYDKTEINKMYSKEGKIDKEAAFIKKINYII